MKAVPGLVFALSLIVLVLSSIGLVHAGTTYLPAVSAGQSADYKPLYNTCTGDPTFCASVSSGDSFTSVDHGTLQVVSVSGTSVTLRLLTAYLNGTTKSMGVAVDVYWGTSNITALGGTPTDYFVLAGGLQAGDHVSYPSTSPTLNSTDSRMVLGASRMVNFLNYSSFIGYGAYGETTSTGFAFDKQTGVFIEAAFSISASSPPPYGSYSFSFALGMVDNNIWVSHGSPDFTIGASPTSVNTDQGSTGTSTISITRMGGLTSTIQLTASPSSSVLTCSLSSTSLPVGDDSSTLSCSGSPGTYTVIVTGDSGSGTHTVSVIFNLATGATPGFTISSSGGVSFQTGSSGSSIITLNAQNGFSSAINLQVIAPSGLTCTLSATSLPGYGTFTLTCNGQPGTYTVTVTGTSGQTSHSTQVPVQVSSLPTSTQTSKTTTTTEPTILSLAVILAALGIVAVVAVLVAFLLLRRRSYRPAIAPSVPPTSFPTP